MGLSNEIIDSFELGDRIRRLALSGIAEPILNNCSNIPKHTQLGEYGLEGYSGIGVDARAGEVMDTHGNVVNLRELREKALIKYCSTI